MEATIQKALPEIKDLFEKYEVESAYLFGSSAKETSTEQSDVDFLIRFKTGLDYQTYGSNYFELLYSLQKLLNKDVDLVAEETLSNPYFIESINRSKIQLL
jgi:predicted nucleotidyltransferase